MIRGPRRLVDPSSGAEIASFRIHRILFCAGGIVDSPDANCFAFVSAKDEGPSGANYQCHVFR